MRAATTPLSHLRSILSILWLAAASLVYANEVVIVPDPATAASLNPNWKIDTGAYNPTSNIFSHLVVLDWGVTRGTNVYGDLAREWTISDDGLTYTFHLHEGVLWHDGTPLTSADIRYTFEHIIEMGYPLATYLRTVASIEDPTPTTLIIRLTRADPPFLPMLAQASNWYGKILPKHLYEGTDWTTNPVNDRPVGSGPFRFGEWDRGSYVILRANPDYFRGAPAIDVLVFQHVPDVSVATSLYQAGEIPYLPSQYVLTYGEVAALLANPATDSSVVRTPSNFGRDLYFNVQRAPFNDARVREAIATAIDRDAINQTAFFGLWPTVRTAGLEVMGDYLNRDALYPAFDAARAEQLLDEAGYPRRADGWRFATTLTNPAIADTALIAEVLTQQLRAIGIDVTWQRFDGATWNQRMAERNFDMSIYFVRSGPDAESYREHFHSAGPRNFMGYQNARIDELLDRGQGEANTLARQALYQEAQAILVRDMPAVSLFNQVRFSFVRPGWTGFAVQESGFDRAISWFGYWAVQPPSR
jgi:peptide/nickel transport system substrate-binding protein